LIGEVMFVPVPEGKFRDKDGSLMDINDFDAAKLGPYPKCHPHFEEHQVEGADNKTEWVKNSAAPKGGPFPVGHPENPEWVTKSDADMKKETEDNRFTWAGLQPNLHLLVMATLSVLLGVKHAVWLFTEAPEDRDPAAQQVMQAKDAAWFPVMGSCVLFGLFAVLKYLGTDWVKFAITCGVVVMCMFGVGTNFDHIFAVIRNKTSKPLFTIPYLEEKMTLMELLGCCVGAAMAAGYVFSKNWIINNVFGVSFCIVGIKMIGLSNYKTGAIMLVGLFFYDIFWVFGSKSVFGSNVMVSVAVGVEAPIKLMFPRSVGGCGTLRHGMLGLGDIVVPGIFLNFLAKWDAVKMGEKKSSSFVYLNTTMVAYVLSLVTTVAIMLFFNAAQPALLYIVPYVLVTSVIVALLRGEFWELWSFTIPDEAAEAEEAKKAAEEEKKDT